MAENEATTVLAENTTALAAHHDPRVTVLGSVFEAYLMHPEHALTFVAALPLLRPTHELMQTRHERIYVSHVRELLRRIAHDADLTLPTAAELMIVCSETSLLAPPKRAGAALYVSLFAEVFEEHPVAAEVARNQWAVDE